MSADHISECCQPEIQSFTVEWISRLRSAAAIIAVDVRPFAPLPAATKESSMLPQFGLSRRRFLASSLIAGGASASQLQRLSAAPLPRADRADDTPAFISTWRFGQPANELALKTLQERGSMLDAIEKGIGLVEADASNASVGIGGIPNADGVVQLDACIMAGPGHEAGSVAGLEDILHPISVARRVMETTRHVMLVGSGAQQFAIPRGVSQNPITHRCPAAELGKLPPRTESAEGRRAKPRHHCNGRY